MQNIHYNQELETVNIVSLNPKFFIVMRKSFLSNLTKSKMVAYSLFCCLDWLFYICLCGVLEKEFNKKPFLFLGYLQSTRIHYHFFKFRRNLLAHSMWCLRLVSKRNWKRYWMTTIHKFITKVEILRVYFVIQEATLSQSWITCLPFPSFWVQTST